MAEIKIDKIKIKIIEYKEQKVDKFSSIKIGIYNRKNKLYKYNKNNNKNKKFKNKKKRENIIKISKLKIINRTRKFMIKSEILTKIQKLNKKYSRKMSNKL